jgi:hypothetical protein
VLRASDSVRHSFNFVFDRIRSVMASADDNAAQLPADPGFLTPPSRVVMRGAFRGIRCIILFQVSTEFYRLLSVAVVDG